MAKYTTKISFGKKSKKRRVKRNFNYKASSFTKKRSSSGRYSSKKKTAKSKIMRVLKNRKVRKALNIAVAGGFVLLFFTIVFVLWYVQKISRDLPSPDAPFGLKNSASVIYDRNGVQLYKVYGNENRDPLELPSEDALITDVVPEEVVWAFLAAEDVDFFKHPGFDITSIINCGLKNLSGRAMCGGSTITQQLVKQTVLSSERRLERKVKELILALQVERKYTKDQILAMYLTVVPMGSNVYGVNTGARFYFGKDLKDLTIAEAAILASIPQNPSFYSPTLSIDPENAGPALKTRQNYVLDQMLKYKDKINKAVGDDEFITEEVIEQARNEEIHYVEPRIDIKAPHFVFYVQKLLQERGYNNGKPFTLADLETSGLKITTTVDYELQKQAEDIVKNKGVGVYGARYGAKNAALITLRPSTGEILAYVGSKDFNAKKEGDDFDPQVDILSSLQQPGSSAKPLTYYETFNQGIFAPGSQVPDIPIQIGNYRPKNSDGRFNGMATVRQHLVNSRNIPAVIALETIGVSKYVENAKSFGYTTFSDPSHYGPSITLGAADVKPVEHAQAFSVFANGGDFVQHEAILKIEDRYGNVIYEHKPERKQVANPQAVFLVNDVLMGVPKANPNAFRGDGRQVAAKTGTSENSMDTWYVMYSPEFVTIGWLGNNKNRPMRRGAFGSTSVKPWVQEYMSTIMGYFPEKRAFVRPGGISYSQICSGEGEERVCIDGNDLTIEGKMPPTYLIKKKFLVCDDQPDHLAREIDINTGHAVEMEFTSYQMPVESLQKYVDEYLAGKGQAFPVDECTIERSPVPGHPWILVEFPEEGSIQSDNIHVKFNAYTDQGIITKVDVYIDSELKQGVTVLPFDGTFSISDLSAGNHAVRFIVYDSTGRTGEYQVNFSITAGTFSWNTPTGDSLSAPVNISVSYDGPASPMNVKLCVDGVCNFDMTDDGSGNYTYTWNPAVGTYEIQVKDDTGAVSSIRTIDII